MNELKISYKKSLVKFKGKTILFEIKSSVSGESEETIFWFADRSLHKDIKGNPFIVLEVMKEIESLSKILEYALSTDAKISLTYKGMITRKTYILNDSISYKVVGNDVQQDKRGKISGRYDVSTIVLCNCGGNNSMIYEGIHFNPEPDNIPIHLYSCSCCGGDIEIDDNTLRDTKGKYKKEYVIYS